MIAGDDPRPWKLLSGGTITAIERDGDVIGIVVELLSVRVKLLLAGCDAIRYQPHDEPVLYELDAIAASEPDIRDAHVDHGAIVVDGGAGTLRVAYANARLAIDGAEIELDALRQLVP